MSKYVKTLMINEFKNRLTGVNDALLVNIVGMESNMTMALRKRLREKNIHLMVVKNSLGRKATEGTPLAAAFEGAEGALALVWGGEDIVSLAKEIIAITESKDFTNIEPKGGVLEGAKLVANDVKAVSTWPSRTEQLSILVGQIMGPGANLATQLLGPGRKLASQVKKKSEEEGGDAS